MTPIQLPRPFSKMHQHPNIMSQHHTLPLMPSLPTLNIHRNSITITHIFLMPATMTIHLQSPPMPSLPLNTPADCLVELHRIPQNRTHKSNLTIVYILQYQTLAGHHHLHRSQYLFNFRMDLHQYPANHTYSISQLNNSTNYKTQYKIFVQIYKTSNRQHINNPPIFTETWHI